jgi:hypothetical protein
LAGVLLRIRKMKEPQLVISIYGIEAFSCVISLILLLSGFPAK